MSSTEGLRLSILMRLAELKPVAGETPGQVSVGMTIAFREVLDLMGPIKADLQEGK